MTHVDWRPYPKEKPTRTDNYLITIKRGRKLCVTKDCYDTNEGEFEIEFNTKIIAWAEMPEPYRPEANMSESKTVWHSYPKQKPKKNGYYFLQFPIGTIGGTVGLSFFDKGLGEFEYNENIVIAWAEINYPEPYKPEGGESETSSKTN